MNKGTHAFRQPNTENQPQKRLTEESMSGNLKNMEYAVRGQVVIAADRINEQLQLQNPNEKSKFPFDHIVYTNIGNPHSVGQKPLTWPRQVMALVDLPDEVGVDHKHASKMFNSDVLDRARQIKRGLGGMGSGAYSHSQGVKSIRDDVVSFIQQRDGGIPSNPDLIFLTNGASSGIHMILTALIANENCGVMLPIPQYPIYSATIDLLGGKKVSYFLDEKNGWDLNMEELERSLLEAREQGTVVNSFVLINPGNPTGQVLSRKAVKVRSYISSLLFPVS
jgi:aspartate/methionine/tyrosine aminotransferase